MRLFCDRNGFPELGLDDECGLRLAVLPMTKRQFEIFLAEPSGLGNSWYSNVLKLNPRVSSKSFDPAKREGLWMTGVTPDEAASFLRWLGGDYRLPSPEEWRRVVRLLDAQPAPRDLPEQVALAARHPAAREIIARLWRTSRPRSWSEFLLFRGGVVEWLDHPGGPTALGAPRPSFFPNTFDVFAGDTVRPLDDRRLPIFGFRPFRSAPVRVEASR